MVTEEEVQFWVDDLDDEARHIEQEEFTRKFGGEYSVNCRRLMDEVKNRRGLMEQCKRPNPFGAFDRDEIERILASDLNLHYEGYEMDFGADLENCTDCNDAIYMVSKTTAAEESWERFQFMEECKKYLNTAASFAKSIGAAPAMRLYLRAYLILEPVSADGRITPENAKRFTAFERMATELLTVDYLAAQLPPPKRPKKAAKSTKKASAKKKGGGK